MKKNNKGKLPIILGLLLITAALFLTAYNLYDEYRAEQTVQQAVNRLEELLSTEDEPVPMQEMEIPDYILNPDMEMIVETVGGVEYIGILRIPTLELELPVISQWSYPNLKISHAGMLDPPIQMVSLSQPTIMPPISVI